MRIFLGVLCTIFTLSLLAQNEMKRPDLPGELMVDVGLNFWSTSPDGLAQRAWPSKSVAVYYLKREALTGSISAYYGLGLSMDKMAFKTESSTYFDLSREDGDTEITEIEDFDGSVSKYKIATTFLEIPVELRFHPNGTKEGEGFFVGVGGLLGLRLSASDKLVFTRDGDKIKQKEIQNFGMNMWRYGAQARIGFRGIHLFYKRYFSTVFNNEVDYVSNNTVQDTYNPTLSTVGINITGF